jgi:transcriptional regulator with XRE-family HTH domain
MQQETEPFDLPLTLGQQFQAARKRTGLDQAGLGEVFDVDRTTISRWERGTHVPPFDVVVRLADLSGWPLRLFAQAIPTNPTPETGGPISAEPGSPCTRSPLADVLPFRLAS